MTKSEERPDVPGVREPEIEEAFDRLVDEGQTRLGRPLLALVSTGLLGGIDVGTGVLAYFVVKQATGDGLLAGLAFSVGFVVLLLARGELFTENFLVPVITMVAGKGRPIALVRLWGVTLATNLAGGWVIAWLIVTGLPDLKATAVATGAHYAALGVNTHSFALAVLAGMVITLMTRTQHASENLGVQMVPSILLGALLAAGGLFHCVLDSLYMFAALIAGAPFGYLDWLSALAWSALGNLVGGLVLVTAIRVLRVPHKVVEERVEASDEHAPTDAPRRRR